MHKHIALFRKPSAVARDAFVSAIEQAGHPPRLMPADRREYRRNHVLPDGAVAAGHIQEEAPHAGYDLITTMLLPEDQEPDWADLAGSVSGELIQTFVAEEHRSPLDALGAQPPQPNDTAAIKMICMIRRRPGMSRDDFIDYYETAHSRLAARHLPMIAGYHRSYMLPNGASAPRQIPALDIDVMTEMWFRSQADFDAMQVALTDPALGAMFAADEEKLFDRKNIQMFLVDERIG